MNGVSFAKMGLVVWDLVELKVCKALCKGRISREFIDILELFFVISDFEAFSTIWVDFQNC